MSEQTKKLNSYTSEFKDSAVKLAIESDRPIARTAEDFSILRAVYTLAEEHRIGQELTLISELDNPKNLYRVLQKNPQK